MKINLFEDTVATMLGLKPPTFDKLRSGKAGPQPFARGLRLGLGAGLRGDVLSVAGGLGGSFEVVF